MTHITIDRALLDQALSLLLAYKRRDDIAHEVGIIDVPEALRAALEQSTDIRNPISGLAPAQQIAQALNCPGCSRLREWSDIGPVQRAAVEHFADLLITRPQPAAAQPELIGKRAFCCTTSGAMCK